MDQLLADSKRLVQRLHNHDSAVDILISETTNLQNKLIAMRQYHDEINKLNDMANHRPRSTLILGSQLENQRIQNLEQENRELSISLAEHQSALELIMNKYREQVLIMMKANGTEMSVRNKREQLTDYEVAMSEKIAEMACVMRQSALIDENVAVQEIEALRSLQVENENLRELLEISGKGSSKGKQQNFSEIYNGLVDENDSGMALGTTEKNSFVKNKDSGIYDNENLAFVNIKSRKDQKKNSQYQYYDSLENLFTKPDPSNERNIDTPLPSVDDLDPDLNQYTNPLENCFRAIITDIKPMEEDIAASESDLTNGIGPEINDIKIEQVQDICSDSATNLDRENINFFGEEPDLNSVSSLHHENDVDVMVKEYIEKAGITEERNVLTGTTSSMTEKSVHVETENTLDSSNIRENGVVIGTDNVTATDNIKINNDSAENDNENSALEMLDSVLDFEFADGDESPDDSSNLHTKDDVDLLANDDKCKEPVQLNGDVSDDDSEVTFTEEDVDQVLSGFDSILDDEFDDDDDDSIGYKS